jgi:hypothetical protein
VQWSVHEKLKEWWVFIKVRSALVTEDLASFERCVMLHLLRIASGQFVLKKYTKKWCGYTVLSNGTQKTLVVEWVHPLSSAACKRKKRETNITHLF